MINSDHELDEIFRRDDDLDDDPAVLELDSNPLSIKISDLFLDEPNDPSDDEDEPGNSLPRAFREHSAIRNAYIRTFMLHAFYNMSHKAIKFALKGEASTFGHFLCLGRTRWHSHCTPSNVT